MTAVRVTLRVLLIPLTLVVAVIAQLAVVNRAPLPSGTAPDLVLLVVTALAVSTGPMIGTLAGFAGGLALDIAPPGGHLAGEYALVFCLVGYACGRIRAALEEASGEHATVTALTVMAAGAAAGEAGKAALGMMLSDPSVTGPAVKHVLPGAILYDLLLSAFVLWLARAALRRAAPARAPRPQFPAAPLTAVFRLASNGAAPGLRLAGSSPSLVPPLVRPEPRLRLAAGRHLPLSRTAVASSLTRQPAAPVGGRAVKLNFSSAGGGSALRAPASPPGRSPGKGWLRPEKPAAAPRLKSPGRGWLRPERPAPAPRPGSPGRGWLRPAKPAAAPRLRSPGKGWLRPERPAAAPRLRSPGKGWLRPERPAAAPRLRSPGRGWLRPERPAAAPRLRSPGKGWLRPAKPVRQSWYTRSPSTRRLKRGRRWRLSLLVGGRR